MSVLIKDMKKPKSCYAITDGETEFCPFVNTDDDCVLLSKKGICEETWEMQYSKCPLVEVPVTCEDAVSRKAVYEAMIEKGQRSRRYRLGETWELNGTEIREALDTVPSVTSKRKTGKWIDRGYTKVGFHCSECGGYAVSGKEKYCPNCGADMRQREENK